MTTLGTLEEKVLLHLISLDKTFLSSSKTIHCGILYDLFNDINNNVSTEICISGVGIQTKHSWQIETKLQGLASKTDLQM